MSPLAEYHTGEYGTDVITSWHDFSYGRVVMKFELKMPNSCWQVLS